jgi:hypothetical protein
LFCKCATHRSTYTLMPSLAQLPTDAAAVQVFAR